MFVGRTCVTSNIHHMTPTTTQASTSTKIKPIIEAKTSIVERMAVVIVDNSIFLFSSALGTKTLCGSTFDGGNSHGNTPAKLWHVPPLFFFPFPPVSACDLGYNSVYDVPRLCPPRTAQLAEKNASRNPCAGHRHIC